MRQILVHATATGAVTSYPGLSLAQLRRTSQTAFFQPRAPPWRALRNQAQIDLGTALTATSGGRQHSLSVRSRPGELSRTALSPFTSVEYMLQAEIWEWPLSAALDSASSRALADTGMPAQRVVQTIRQLGPGPREAGWPLARRATSASERAHAAHSDCPPASFRLQGESKHNDITSGSGCCLRARTRSIAIAGSRPHRQRARIRWPHEPQRRGSR